MGKPSDEAFYYVLHGPGIHFMNFTLLGKSKRIFQINISDGREG